MEEKNKIYLTGYFDSNFGDDMMMKLVVQNLPDFTFVVEENIDTPILSEANVVRKSYKECALLPKLVVTGCGFMINSEEALKTEIMWLLKGHNPGDYCLGCNIEPLDTPIKNFLISRKLNKFKLITCRDQFSYDWIKKHTRRPVVRCLPDILFSIPDQWFTKYESADKLGISLMHRAGDTENCEYYRIMAETADEWVQKTRKKVILMAFDTGKENDLFACCAVKSLMKYSDYVEIVAHKNGTEILEAFSQCEKIIGARFHSIVLALRMGIPVYPLIFREKVRNLLKDVKYPFSVSTIDDIDKASLHCFIEEVQTPYKLEKEIMVRANEHAQLLKQQLVQ